MFATIQPRRSLDFSSRLACAPRAFPFRHRDEKPITATPLESALTNRDARNLFRIRSYENCRVSHPSSKRFSSLSVHRVSIALDNFAQPLSFHILPHSFALIKNSTLLFSIDSTLFAQNTRGWGTPCFPSRPFLQFWKAQK